jgi:transposase
MSNLNDTLSDKEVVRLWNEGKKSREIGELLGCSKTTILNRLRKKGIDTNRKYEYPKGDEHHRYVNVTKNMIMKEKKNGLSVKEICNKYDVSQRVYYDRIKEEVND